MYCSKSIISFLSCGLLATHALAEPAQRYAGNRGEGNLDPRSPSIRGSSRLLERNTYPYPSYQDCLDSIEDVPADKSTFYSGLGYYPNGAGYTYLRNFVAARSLLEVDSVYPDDFCTSDPNLNGGYGAYISFAYSFSGVFAQKSSGTAYLLTPSQCDPSPNSIWYTVELGNLTSDPSVTQIIRVDPSTTSISTTIYPVPTGSTIPSLTICPTDPPLPSGGSSASATATSAPASASATSTSVAQANPICEASLGVDTGDATTAQSNLAAEGNGGSKNNCCAGGAIPCQQIAVSGTAVVDLCAGDTQQCAGCADLAVALNDIIVDCTDNYKVGGNVSIPYLDGVTLELNLNDSP